MNIYIYIFLYRTQELLMCPGLRAWGKLIVTENELWKPVGSSTGFPAPGVPFGWPEKVSPLRPLQRSLSLAQVGPGGSAQHVIPNAIL